MQNNVSYHFCAVISILDYSYQGQPHQVWLFLKLYMAVLFTQAVGKLHAEQSDGKLQSPLVPSAQQSAKTPLATRAEPVGHADEVTSMYWLESRY